MQPAENEPAEVLDAIISSSSFTSKKSKRRKGAIFESVVALESDDQLVQQLPSQDPTQMMRVQGLEEEKSDGRIFAGLPVVQEELPPYSLDDPTEAELLR